MNLFKKKETKELDKNNNVGEFANDLVRYVRTEATEKDLSYATVLGCLDLVKEDVCQHFRQKNNNDQIKKAMRQYTG